MSKSHVVFGGGGALGSAIVRQLVAEGIPVRAVVGDVESAKRFLPEQAGIVYGDATFAKSARSACEGAEVIYHCVNVRYSKWTTMMPGITKNILAAALHTGARLVFPGNVHVYGPLQQVPATEEHPQAATSKKGQLRIALEQEIIEMHRASRVPAVIPRFPDLYGPFVVNPLMRPIFESAVAGKGTTWPGNLNVPHDLLYVEDAARACVLLGTTRSAFGQVWHVPGPGALTGRQFLEMVYGETGTSGLKEIKALGRRLFRFVGAFIPDAGEMVELLYQFEQPTLLDGSKFAEAFPSFDFTPHKEAVRRTVRWFRDGPDLQGSLSSPETR